MVLLCVPQTGSAQERDTIILTAGDLRATALQNLRSGQPARALAIAEALLLRDPKDPLALRVAGRAALDIGQASAASRHGRALYALADTPEGRFFAARLVALAEAQQENFTRSQIWLRRARQAAPTPAAAQSIASDYRAVRQRNPLAFAFDFGVRPSSNINNGSSVEEYEIPGRVVEISPDGQALDGYVISTGAQLTYRLRQTERAQTAVRVGGQILRYALSDQGKGTAPDFDTSELSYDRATLGIIHDWRSASGQPYQATLQYGLTRIDGSLYARDLRTGLASRWKIGDASVLSASVSLNHIDYVVGDVTTQGIDATVSWRRSFANGHAVTVQAGIGRTDSDAPALAFRRHNVNFTYDFGSVAELFDLSVGIGRDWKTGGVSIIAPQGRDDVRTSAYISVGVPRAELYGFSPVFRLEGSDTDSDIPRFQGDSLSLDVGFTSNF